MTRKHFGRALCLTGLKADASVTSLKTGKMTQLLDILVEKCPSGGAQLCSRQASEQELGELWGSGSSGEGWEVILSPAKSAHLLQAEQRECGMCSPLLLSERGFEMIFK